MEYAQTRSLASKILNDFDIRGASDNFKTFFVWALLLIVNT